MKVVVTWSKAIPGASGKLLTDLAKEYPSTKHVRKVSL
jgi:hypothetical protein